MTITSRDAFFDALANNNSRLNFDKASIANAAATQYHSLWRANGVPGQGAIPGAAAVCDEATVGGMTFTQQASPAKSYLGLLEALCTNAGTTIEVHDRIAHMGGLSGIVTTAQTVNLDISALLASADVDERKGGADYSDVTWWLEWYTDTGSTAVSATVNVTYDDNSTGNLTAIALAATRRASLMIPLNVSIPAAASGRKIKAVNSVTLSATTGTAGNFGVTATRFRGSVYMPVASAKFKADWKELGVPDLPNSSCLFLVQIASTTTTGVVRGVGKVAHG